ncbi:hypothetical protein POVWA2_002570 [Plasmodium ovale wallikeri]|uniref:Pv-fam-d protein n=2 Tax=Plasmodium ovale TaxID=36330 RepID=A0A1A9AM71_PLAOA|nr:hypothetical protein POVWA2_002570 [Plasmodium ovale wallikeri]SBT57182.1 hypothetical protein POVWA1_080580 [Plasmodium ovale wallikeri]SBT72733.1 Plasmodium exported protein, unknown function [Plasmodium ovale]
MKEQTVMSFSFGKHFMVLLSVWIITQCSYGIPSNGDNMWNKTNEANTPYVRVSRLLAANMYTSAQPKHENVHEKLVEVDEYDDDNMWGKLKESLKNDNTSNYFDSRNHVKSLLETYDREHDQMTNSQQEDYDTWSKVSDEDFDQGRNDLRNKCNFSSSCEYLTHYDHSKMPYELKYDHYPLKPRMMRHSRNMHRLLRMHSVEIDQNAWLVKKIKKIMTKIARNM